MTRREPYQKMSFQLFNLLIFDKGGLVWSSRMSCLQFIYENGREVWGDDTHVSEVPLFLGSFI